MYTFKKQERLCSKKRILQLWRNGCSFLCYPFKVTYLVWDQTEPLPVQVLFLVAKKRYKKAVDRNLLKRRMREAYRLLKQALLYNDLQAKNKFLLLSIAYIGKEGADYKFVKEKMHASLTQVHDQLTR